jgi:hypothetical protein
MNVVKGTDIEVAAGVVDEGVRDELADVGLGAEEGNVVGITVWVGTCVRVDGVAVELEPS